MPDTLAAQLAAAASIRGQMKDVEAARQAATAPLLDAARQAAAVQSQMLEECNLAVRAVEAMRPAIDLSHAWQAHVADIHQSIQHAVQWPALDISRQISGLMESIHWPAVELSRQVAEMMEALRHSFLDDLLGAIDGQRGVDVGASAVAEPLVSGLPPGVGTALCTALNVIGEALDFADGVEVEQLLMRLALALLIWPLFYRRPAVAA